MKPTQSHISCTQYSIALLAWFGFLDGLSSVLLWPETWHTPHFEPLPFPRTRDLLRCPTRKGISRFSALLSGLLTVNCKKLFAALNSAHWLNDVVLSYFNHTFVLVGYHLRYDLKPLLSLVANIVSFLSPWLCISCIDLSICVFLGRFVWSHSFGCITFV